MPKDCYAGKSFCFWSRLRLRNGFLKSGCRGVAFSTFWRDEAESNEMVWIREGQKIVPIFLVKASKRRKDEDSLLVFNRVRRGSQVVQPVVNYLRRNPFTICLSCFLPEGCCGGRQWI